MNDNWPSIQPTGYHTIYFVYCKHSTDLLYVGVTGYRLKKRFNSNKWFRERDMWYEPVMYFVDRSIAEEWEAHFIKFLKPPLNIRFCGYKQTDEFIQKRTEARRGYLNTTTHNRKIGEANGLKVRCVETGDEFYSMAEAARWCNGSDSKISLVTRGKRKTHKGYKWELV